MNGQDHVFWNGSELSGGMALIGGGDPINAAAPMLCVKRIPSPKRTSGLEDFQIAREAITNAPGMTTIAVSRLIGR